jgi:uncharacterized protein
MASMIEKRTNPAPLGLAGFGLTTILLSLVNAGVLPAAGQSVVLPLALFFGGLIQLIAGVMEYREGNTFGTTVFTSYGAFWIWFASMVILANVGALNLKGANSAIGVCLLLWALLTAGFWVASFRLTRLISSAVFMADVTLVLLGLGEILESQTLHMLGGWAGVITGLLATYASSAVLINTELGRAVLPTGVRTQTTSDELLVRARVETRPTA